jgi:hypothetical protein
MRVKEVVFVLVLVPDDPCSVGDLGPHPTDDNDVVDIPRVFVVGTSWHYSTVQYTRISIGTGRLGSARVMEVPVVKAPALLLEEIDDG